MRILISLLVFFLATNFALAKTAKNGDNVSVQYIGTLKDGRVFDHNIGKKPLSFTIGAGDLIQDFEEALLGMNEGETKKITIEAKNAYGEFDVNKLFRIYRKELPKDAKEGDTLKYWFGSAFYPVRIVDIGEKEVFIDANHKLAGKDLEFEITLKSVN